MLCDNLEGRVGAGDGREFQEGGDIRMPMVSLWLIHVDMWQKPTQYCKAIILQLKINKFKQNKKKETESLIGDLHRGEDSEKTGQVEEGVTGG